MVTVWERLGEMFGQVFENSFGDAEGSAIETWTRGLSDYSETSIRAALDLLKGWTSPFPPSLGQFAEMCRTYRPAIPPDRQLKQETRRISEEEKAAWFDLWARIGRGEHVTQEEILSVRRGS